MRVAHPESSMGVQFPGNLARPSQSRKASERATHKFKLDKALVLCPD